VKSDELLLFHRRTRASCVYNGCLAWYNVVLYNCLSWYKFVNTHLYHSRQLYNIHVINALLLSSLLLLLLLLFLLLLMLFYSVIRGHSHALTTNEH